MMIIFDITAAAYNIQFHFQDFFRSEKMYQTLPEHLSTITSAKIQERLLLYCTLHACNHTELLVNLSCFQLSSL